MLERALGDDRREPPGDDRATELAGEAGGEFDLIREMLRQWGRLARGVGDDAAVVAVPAGEQLVVSTDAAIDGVHFRREWLSTREIGYRAATAALSDLAAMAARPLGMLLALALPRTARDEVTELAAGIGEAAEVSGTPIVGGNITAASELSLTMTVLGAARRPLRRSGARVGDHIYITGCLGGVRAALEALARKAVADPEHLARYARPAARLREAQWLAARGARAMIDVSDGLAADVAHLAAASAVRIQLELEAVPRVRGVAPLDAATSGEEFELAFAAPPGTDLTGFPTEFALPVTPIGRVVGGSPGVEATLEGERVALPRGHEHFSE